MLGLWLRKESPARVVRLAILYPTLLDLRARWSKHLGPPLGQIEIHRDRQASAIMTNLRNITVSLPDTTNSTPEEIAIALGYAISAHTTMGDTWSAAIIAHLQSIVARASVNNTPAWGLQTPPT